MVTRSWSERILVASSQRRDEPVSFFIAAALAGNREDSVGRIRGWQNGRSWRGTAFRGFCRCYVAGISNKLSGDPVVCSFIMISTRCLPYRIPLSLSLYSVSAFLYSLFYHPQCLFVCLSLVPSRSLFRFDFTPARHSFFFSSDFLSTHLSLCAGLTPVYTNDRQYASGARTLHAFWRVLARETVRIDVARKNGIIIDTGAQWNAKRRRASPRRRLVTSFFFFFFIFSRLRPRRRRRCRPDSRILFYVAALSTFSIARKSCNLSRRDRVGENFNEHRRRIISSNWWFVEFDRSIQSDSLSTKKIVSRNLY